MALKVTARMRADSVKKNIQNTLAKLEKSRKQVSTGLRVDRPSEDTVRANRILDLRSNIDQNEQYISNTAHSQGMISTATSAYQEIADVMMRVRELTHFAMSDTNNPSDYKFLATEVDQLMETVLATSNTDFTGVPIFAGTKADGLAFEAQREQNLAFIRDYRVFEDPVLNSITISATDAEKFVEADRITLSNGSEEESAMIYKIEVDGDLATINLASPLQRAYFSENATVSTDDGNFSTNLVGDTSIMKLILPFDRVQSTLSANDLIRISDAKGAEEAMVASVDGDLLTNRAIVTLKRPLNGNYSLDNGVHVTKNDVSGTGKIIGVAYVGNGGIQQERVGKSAFIDITERGDVALQRVFDQMLELRSAITNGGHGDLEDLAARLDQTIEHVTVLQVENGAKLNRNNTLRVRLEDQNLALKEFLQQVEEIDMPTALVEYQSLQAILNATLSTGAQALTTSLFNFV